MIAIGALVVSYSDGFDPYVYRARRMLSSSVLCAVAVLAGALSAKNSVLCNGHRDGVGVRRGVGGRAGRRGGGPGAFQSCHVRDFRGFTPSLERAALFSVLTFLGGLLQTGLALVLWPLRRYEPERHELGKLYLEFARMAVSPIRSKETPLASAEITRAQKSLVGLARDHSVSGERYRSLLSQAERIRLCLFSLSHLRKNASDGKTPNRRPRKSSAVSPRWRRGRWNPSGKLFWPEKRSPRHQSLCRKSRIWLGEYGKSASVNARGGCPLFLPPSFAMLCLRWKLSPGSCERRPI